MSENSGKTAKEQPRRGPGRPFQPGQTGNPGGRPKGFAGLIREKTRDGASLVEYAIRVHEGLEVNAGEGSTVKERVAVAELRMDAGRWLADRGWGSPHMDVELSGEGGEPLQIVVTTYKDMP